MRSTNNFGRASTANSFTRSVSSTTLLQLPNLPGVKSNVASINPKIYKEFKASQNEGYSQQDSQVLNRIESIESYFDTPESLEYFKSALNPFPKSVENYNDISGRCGLRSQHSARLNKTRSLPYCNLNQAPAFVMNDPKVCRFLGYFSDPTLENGREIIKSRVIELTFYLEDNTLEINEKKVNNCGILQGKILKRHQVLKPDRRGNTTAGLIYTIDDFKAGAELVIYNRTYVMIDCDNFTKRTLQEYGLNFGQSLPVPDNIYKVKEFSGRSSSNSTFSAKKESPSKRGAGFYKYDKKVLRFTGLWDDTGSLYGDKVMVSVHYFLAEDSIEVYGIKDRNSCRDVPGRLLKKMKIPKSDTLDALTMSTNTILQDGEPIEMIHWKDMQIGSCIKIASMRIQIIDADDVTRSFFYSEGYPLGDAIFISKAESSVNFSNKSTDSVNSAGSFVGDGKKKGKILMNSGIILRFLAKISDPKVLFPPFLYIY